MRINNIGPGRPASSTSKAKSTRSTFQSVIEQGQPQRIPGGLPVSPLVNIVPISSEDHEQANKREALQIATTLLDELELLHREVCFGEPSRSRLQSLARQIESTIPPSDPELRAIYDEIETRIAVELARYSRT